VAGNKQADIVAAAVRLFHEKGFHATSMQDIADAVGLQKGSLYHYIGGKEELLVLIIGQVIGQYNEALERIRALNLPVRQRLELAVRSHLKGIADNMPMLTIFLRESYALHAEQQALIGTETARYNRMFEELYQEGVSTGDFRPMDPRLVTRTLLGACNWFHRWYRPEGSQSVEELAGFMVDMLFQGIAAEHTA
jgi:TetR/AcrR family transcriptional regulator, cholesterol catabolism regulator